MTTYEEMAAEIRAMPRCLICRDSGWDRQPDWFFSDAGVRCPNGCPSRCPICSDPNCDNPGGKH